jgi:hypothetical protein
MTRCRAQKRVMQRPGKCGVTRRAQVPRRSFDKLAAGEASSRRVELFGPASDVVANDCITKLENAHGTEFGELLYPWHPWAGGLHESVSKADGIVFRCRLHGRRLEIPAWMFDRSACARVRVAADAHVDFGAVAALTALLRSASSNAPLSGAPELSHDQNQGEVHATADKAASEATPRTTADRPVRRRTAQLDRQHAGVVHAAAGHTSGADQLDNAIDPGARRRETDWLNNGGDRS